MLDEKLRLKIEKINALAKNGFGGEKINAEKILYKLLAKHGLSIGDLQNETKFSFCFNCNNMFEIKLLLQIHAMVIDSVDVTYRQKNKKIWIKCSIAENVEIELYFSAYKKSLKEGFEIYFKAFVSKNHIFAKSVPARKPTAEEIEKQMKVWALSSGIEKTTVNKAIENKN